MENEVNLEYGMQLIRNLRELDHSDPERGPSDYPEDYDDIERDEEFAHYTGRYEQQENHDRPQLTESG